MVLAGRQSEIGHAFNTELVPWIAQIFRLEELDLVGDTASAELLVGRVLQVPAGLRLLHVFADDCALGALSLIRQGLPDLQVLLGVTLIILRRQLPCDDVCAEW